MGATLKLQPIEADILPLEQVIKNHVLGAFQRCDRNIKITAKKLRIGRTSLQRYLREWGERD